MIINNYNEIAALGLKLVDNDNEREINKFSFRLSTACVCVCVGVCENLFLTKESRAELVECNKIEFQGIFSPIPCFLIFDFMQFCSKGRRAISNPLQGIVEELYVQKALDL